jgi:hypothetical protein
MNEASWTTTTAVVCSVEPEVRGQAILADRVTDPQASTANVRSSITRGSSASRSKWCVTAVRLVHKKTPGSCSVDATTRRTHHPFVSTEYGTPASSVPSSA